MISWGQSVCSSKRPRGEGRSENVIFFFDKDLVGVHNPNNDTIVVSMIIAKYDVKKILLIVEAHSIFFFYDTFVWINLSLN